jgi:hypothetical protein
MMQRRAPVLALSPLPLAALSLLLALPPLQGCGGGGDGGAPAATPEPPPATPVPGSALGAAPPSATPPSGAASSPFSVVVDADHAGIAWTSVKTVQGKSVEVKGSYSRIQGGLSLTAADLDATTGSFEVDLSSSNSGDPVRDKNILDALWAWTPDSMAPRVELLSLEAERNPLAVGESTRVSARLRLTLPAGSAERSAVLAISRPDADRWQVLTADPIVLSLQELGLDAGRLALTKLCGHEGIDDSVRVSVDLQLEPRGP